MHGRDVKVNIKYKQEKIKRRTQGRKETKN